MFSQTVINILGLDSLLAQLILALGAAMVLGNGYAIYVNLRGKTAPKNGGQFRRAHTFWLLGIGVLIAVWGIASLITE